MTIDKAINKYKDQLKFFFSDPKNQELLNQYKFEELYKEWPRGNNILTALLLKSEINFLSYMSYTPSRCFKSLNIENIIIPNNVINIEKSAFSYCYSLTSITIPNNVKGIGSRCFEFCEKLTSINYLGTKEE